jgi:hypothetical protein
VTEAFLVLRTRQTFRTDARVPDVRIGTDLVDDGQVALTPDAFPPTSHQRSRIVIGHGRAP